MPDPSMGPDQGPDQQQEAPPAFQQVVAPPPQTTYGANVNIPGPTQIKMIGPGNLTTFTMKQGDTLPWLRVQLQDADDSGVDLTGAEVRFHMRQQITTNGTTLVATNTQVNADCAIDDAGDGKISYRWQAGDADVMGTFTADFRVIFPDGTALSFPNAAEFTVRVEGSVALTMP